jgi:hypothetical protein
MSAKEPRILNALAEVEAALRDYAKETADRTMTL